MKDDERKAMFANLSNPKLRTGRKRKNPTLVKAKKKRATTQGKLDRKFNKKAIKDITYPESDFDVAELNGWGILLNGDSEQDKLNIIARVNLISYGFVSKNKTSDKLYKVVSSGLSDEEVRDATIITKDKTDLRAFTDTVAALNPNATSKQITETGKAIRESVIKGGHTFPLLTTSQKALMNKLFFINDDLIAEIAVRQKIITRESINKFNKKEVFMKKSD